MDSAKAPKMMIFGGIPLGISLCFFGAWGMGEQGCLRSAKRIGVSYQWDRLVGCYVLDKTGRYVPLDSYLQPNDARIVVHNQ